MAMTLKISPNAINTYAGCGYKYDLIYNKGHRRSSNSLTFWLGHVAEEMVILHLKNPEWTYEAVWLCAIVNSFDKLPSLPEDVQQALVAFCNGVVEQDKELDEKAETLNRVFREANLPNFTYKPKVKGNKGKSDSLLSNALTALLDDLSCFFDNKAYKEFVSSYQSLDTQVYLELNVPNWEVMSLLCTPDIKFTTLQFTVLFERLVDIFIHGYADFVFELPNNRIVCLDAKYSKHDLSLYNINRDTQLFCYAAALKKAYPNHAIDVGYMVLRENPGIRLCDMGELLSKTTSMRIGMSVKGMKSGIFVPSCGGGGYQSLTKLCDHKDVCEFSSCSKSEV